MAIEAEDSGILKVDSKQMSLLAANVIEALGYRIRKSSRHLNQFLADEKNNKPAGRDTFAYDWGLVLQWTRTTDGAGQLVTVRIEDRTGRTNKSDCLKRCVRILNALEAAAVRLAHADDDREVSTVYGGARWGTEQELREQGYIVKKNNPKSFLLTKYQNGEQLSVPEKSTYKHVLIAGGTGLGKTSGFGVPNLVERLGVNMIVTESVPEESEQGELYTLTAGWRRQAGHKIFSFNPVDMTSTRVNPLDSVRFAKPEEVAQKASSLAELIVINGSKEDSRVDPTWDNSEQQLLVPLILHVAADDPEYAHIGALRWLLLSGPQNIQKVIRRSYSELAQQEFEGWLQNTSENFRFGVTSGLSTKLNGWLTDQVMTLTQRTDFQPEDLRDGLFTFYMATPSRARTMKLVSSLIFNYVLDMALAQKRKMENPLALFLDEFTNFGRIPGIEAVLSIIRKFEVGLVLSFQQYRQLEKNYGKDAQIILEQPGTQIYFRQKPKDAKPLSEALGRMTVEDYKIGDSGQIHEHVMGRNLMTIDELVNLDPCKVIVMTPDTLPVKIDKIPPGAYNMATQYKPPERLKHAIPESIHKRQRYKSSKQETAGSGSGIGKKRRLGREQSRTKGNNRDKRERGKPQERSREAPDAGDVWRAK